MAEPVAPRRVRRRIDAEDGAELIEFALALPLMLVLVTGVFDFGLAFQQYEVVTNAAREGARLGSLGAGYSKGIFKLVWTRTAWRPVCPAAVLPNLSRSIRSATLTVAGTIDQRRTSDRELPAQLRARRTGAETDQWFARNGDPARDVHDAV